MNGNSVIVDTNIILYILNGNKELATLLNGKEIYVSFITELELLGYKGIEEKDKKVIRNFLDDCTIININKQIKSFTLKIKQHQKVKLPDAIIGATAIFLDIPYSYSRQRFLETKRA